MNYLLQKSYPHSSVCGGKHLHNHGNDLLLVFLCWQELPHLADRKIQILCNGFFKGGKLPVETRTYFEERREDDGACVAKLKRSEQLRQDLVFTEVFRKRVQIVTQILEELLLLGWLLDLQNANALSFTTYIMWLTQQPSVLMFRKRMNKSNTSNMQVCEPGSLQGKGCSPQSCCWGIPQMLCSSGESGLGLAEPGDWPQPAHSNGGPASWGSVDTKRTR